MANWRWDEKRAIVAEYFNDRVNVAALARRHGLQTHQIYIWPHVLPAPESPCEFLKIEVSGFDDTSKVPVVLPSVGEAVPVEIDLPGGLAIRVPVSTEAGVPTKRGQAAAHETRR